MASPPFLLAIAIIISLTLVYTSRSKAARQHYVKLLYTIEEIGKFFTWKIPALRELNALQRRTSRLCPPLLPWNSPWWMQLRRANFHIIRLHKDALDVKVKLATWQNWEQGARWSPTKPEDVPDVPAEIVTVINAIGEAQSKQPPFWANWDDEDRQEALQLHLALQSVSDPPWNGRGETYAQVFQESVNAYREVGRRILKGTL